MKTIKIVFSILVLISGFSAKAGEKPTMNTIPFSNDKALVAITNQIPEIFEISLTSSKGEMLYYNKTKRKVTDYKKVFNFSNLNNGDYKLTLKVNNKSLTRKVSVSENGISTGDLKVVYDPFFSFKDNSLKYSFLNFDKNISKLSIYSKEGLIYTKNLGSEPTFTGGLDFSKLENGNYRVELHSGDLNYAFNLEK